MSTFRHKWDDEIWLIHIEANNTGCDKRFLRCSRVMKNGNSGQENRISVEPGESYRFILSRDSVQEIGVDIEFDRALSLKIFGLQDRAYLPGDSDIVYNTDGHGL